MNIHSEFANKFKVPYYNPRDTNIFFNKDFSINAKLFEKLSNNSLSVIDLSLDPFSVVEIKNQFQNNGVDTNKIIFLTSNYDIYSRDSNIIFYPSWLIASSKSLKKLPVNIKKNNKVSCLNNTARSHRFYLFYLLKQKKYFSELIYSLNGLSNYGKTLTWDLERFNDLPNTIKTELKDLNLYLKAVSTETLGINDHTIDHIAYTDSYLNIITESSHILETPFYSEKTIKPIIAGQLFLSVSDKNHIKSVNALGFETFNSTLDNHKYDNFSTYIQRIESMVNLLDNIYENIKSIYFDNIQAIKYNQDYALSYDFRNKFLQPLVELDIIKS
jgi:ASC-1-like (ASCH) protein